MLRVGHGASESPSAGVVSQRCRANTTGAASAPPAARQRCRGPQLHRFPPGVTPSGPAPLPLDSRYPVEDNPHVAELIARVKAGLNLGGSQLLCHLGVGFEQFLERSLLLPGPHRAALDDRVSVVPEHPVCTRASSTRWLQGRPKLLFILAAILSG